MHDTDEVYTVVFIRQYKPLCSYKAKHQGG